MIHSIRRKTAICILSLPLLAGSSLANTLFYDDFPGTALDFGKWTVVSFTDVPHSVSGGQLTIGVDGWHHFNGVRTIENFNFHQSPIITTVDLATFNEPTVWADKEDPMSAELRFAIGPASNRDQSFSSDPTVAGFGFAIRWRPGSQLDLYGAAVPIPATDISGIPDVVSFRVDATSFWITLEGATFTSGPSAGTNTLSGTHELGAYDDYNFLLLQELRGYLHESEAVINSVTIIPEPSTYAAVLGLMALAGMLVHRRRMR